MASRKMKREIPLIPCGWPKCDIYIECVLELNNHIEQHLQEYETGDGEKYVCQWTKCDYQTDCVQKFRRHSFYHGYYEHLLIQGHYILHMHPKVPRCSAPEMTKYKIPELDEDFLCQWTDCERSFESVVEFQDHIVQHASFEYEIKKSPEDQRPKIECNWQFCKKPLRNKYRLIEHIVTHSNKKQLACFNCGEMFRTKTTLFDHLKRQPDNNTLEFQCGQCFKYFSTKRLWRVHVIKHVNCYKCTMCDMTCSSASSLATHIRYRHLKDKPFECTECNARFVRKSDLTRHNGHKHSRLIYSCNAVDCKFTCKSYELLRKHFLQIHGETPFIYACHCCPKYFKTGNSLSQHLIKVHDFQLPSGHKRFIYREDENGIYHLATIRIESLEVTEQEVSPTDKAPVVPQNTTFRIKNSDTGETVILSNGDSDSKPIADIIISLPKITED